MEELERFTGEGWEQEDDITLLTLERSPTRSEPTSIPFPRGSVNMVLLVRLLAFRGRIGAQPQRDVGRLHRLAYHV